MNRPMPDDAQVARRAPAARDARLPVGLRVSTKPPPLARYQGTMKQQTSHLEMQTQELGADVVVEAHAHGTLDGNDYDMFLPQLDALLAGGRRMRFILFLEDFHGWDVEAFARELKWDEKNRDQLYRIAVVGEAGWQKWSTVFSKWFVPGNVKYFDRSDEAAARAWVSA